MKINLKFLAGFIALLLVSCDPGENKEMEKQMLGEWRSLDLRLEMNTYQNKEGSKIFDVKEGEWETKMNIRPIVTYYKENGIYISEHRNLRDSLVFRPAGKWKIIGSELQLQDTFPELGPVYIYTLTIQNNIAELKGVEDSDGDQQADDNYFGRLQRK